MDAVTAQIQDLSVSISTISDRLKIESRQDSDNIGPVEPNIQHVEPDQPANEDIYYTKAIRRNKDVKSMQDAIKATMYHAFSTDKNPKHNLCPKDAGSWCFYNNTIANKKVPPPHKKHLGTPLTTTCSRRT